MTGMPPRRVSKRALLALLSGEEEELVAAAALVLGALRPQGRDASRALEKAADSAPPHLAPYLLDALARIDPDRALPRLARRLEEHGQAREQAIRLIAGLGVRAVPLLARRVAASDPEHSSPELRALGEIPGPEASEVLLRSLRGAGFERAKQLFAIFANRLGRMSTAERNELVQILGRRLGELEDPAADTEAIAILKILGTSGASSAVPAAARAAATRGGAVRLAAFEALRGLPVAPEDAAAVRDAASRALAGDAPPLLLAAALRVLLAVAPETPRAAELAGFARSSEPALARAALVGLRDRPWPEAAEILLAALDRSEPEVQETAIAGLATRHESLPRLAAALEEPIASRLRPALFDVLREQGKTAPPDLFRRILRPRLLAGGPRAPDDPGLLGAVRFDRARTNRLAEACARRALARREHASAIQALEALVRDRQATLRGRYLLALLHLAESGPDGDPAHLERARQLLAPLARIPSFALAARLQRERRLPDPASGALISCLESRSAAERGVADALRRRRTAALPFNPQPGLSPPEPPAGS
jgi:hypothetical protein